MPYAGCDYALKGNTVPKGYIVARIELEGLEGFSKFGELCVPILPTTRIKVFGGNLMHIEKRTPKPVIIAASFKEMGKTQSICGLKGNTIANLIRLGSVQTDIVIANYI